MRMPAGRPAQELSGGHLTVQPTQTRALTGPASSGSYTRRVTERRATLAFIRRIIPVVTAAGILLFALGVLTVTHVIINTALLGATWILCVVQGRRGPGEPRS
jgi:hypothetical protein